MDLKRNPFAFLGEEEDIDVLIENAKASAAASALAVKEAALEEKRKEKNERKTQSFSTRAKRIVLPHHVTKRDIIVRKEKPEGEADAKAGNNGKFQQNSVGEAHRSNGDVKGIINKHNSYNGPVKNNFKGNNNNRVEGSWSRNKKNVITSNGHCPASNDGHRHGGFTGYSNGDYQGNYRKSFYGYVNNGGRGQNQGFSGNNSNAGNQKLEKKVEQVISGVEKNEEEDGWTKVEKRRSRGRRSGSYESSQVSTVSEKDTTLEDVQEICSAENSASEKDTTLEDVQEVSNVENNAIEKNTTREVAQNVPQKKAVTNHSQVLLTLDEYEKSRLEKRKALESLKKTENSRVIQLKDFESMVQVGKKTDDNLSTNENNKDSHNHKNDIHTVEEKGHKVATMVELRKKCGLTFNHSAQKPYGGRRGAYHAGETGKKEPVEGNGAAPQTEKQQPAKGGYVQKTEPNKLSSFEKRRHHKNGDAPEEGEAEESRPLPPIFENREQFPNLGGKVA